MFPPFESVFLGKVANHRDVIFPNFDGFVVAKFGKSKSIFSLHAVFCFVVMSVDFVFEVDDSRFQAVQLVGQFRRQRVA